jgi:chitobiase/beta-hexosaminidase-like protein
MTRKLSGLRSALSTKRAPLASLAIIGALAGALALIGCGSSNKGGPAPVVDAGEGGTGLSESGATACTTPTFSVAAGTVAAGTTVTITATGLPAGGFIYYTTDSTVPTHASTAIPSGGTVIVNATETIYAIAYAAGGCGDSAVASVTYTVGVDAGPTETACAAPTFNPPAGDIAVGSTVAIVPPAGFPATGEIFYTLDGTIPTHTSTAYSGPIQINGTTTEVIHAVAFAANTCTDSTPAVATYTIEQPDSGTVTLPAFNPPSTTQNNDFLVSLTDKAPAATICFTYGAGSTPTCTVSATGATCTGTSQTYNAGAALGATGSVSITAGVTSAAGTVVVNAIACEAGQATTGVVSQTYTLQAAAPTMQGPAPSLTLPYLNAAGTAAAVYTPGISSVTAGSSLRYTTDGSVATCATAMPLTGNPALIPVTVDSTFNAVACKTGYAPSTAAAFTYGIVLPTPTFVDSAGLHAAEGTGTYDAAPTVAFSAAGATSNFCYTTDSSTPTCGTTAATCTHGTAGGSVAITATGTVVTAVACSTSYVASAPGTATYTLQLDAPALDLPGCVNAAGTAASCLAAGSTPVASYDIPANGAAGFLTHVEETLGTLPASAAGVQPTYQFVCAQNGGTPSCLATGCSTGATLINPAAAGDFQVLNTVPLSATGGFVKAGDNWSLIGCPGSASTGFLPSKVTTVAFALPGAAPVPVVVAGTGTGTYNNPVTPTFTNTGTNAEAVCYGTYPVATPPTTALSCSAAGACVLGAGYVTSGSVPAGVAGVLTTVASITLTAPGAGYTSAPTVTIDAPPAGAGALQAQATAALTYGIALPATPTTGGAGCQAGGGTPTAVTFTGGGGAGAAATVTINAADQVTALTVTNPGAGYTTAPTIGFTHCTTAPTVTATLVNGLVTGITVTNAGAGYTGTPNVTFTGGGGTGAAATAVLTATSATAVLPAVQADNTKVDVIGCVVGSPASPPETYTYNFQEAAPTVADTSANPSTPVVGGTTLSLGDTITLSTTSTHFTTAPKVCYTTDGTAPNAACATAGTTICGANGLAIPTTSTTFTTNTIKAIACNATSQTAQTDSAAYTAALNLVVATPTASHPGGTYYNVTTPVLATTTPGAVICYTTVAAATPTCAAGVCTNGSFNQATTAVPTVTATGTVLKATACVGAYSSGVSTNTYALNVTPIVLINDPVLPLGQTAPAVCPAAIGVGLDCSDGTAGTTACSTATVAAGGATAGAQVCYSTNGSAVTSCTPSTTVTCTTAGTLFTTVAATQSVPLTINAIGCAPGFGNSASTTLTIPVTPYSAAVAFTGAPATDFVVTPVNEDQFADNAGTGHGYFSTNGTNLYIGLDGLAPAAATYVTIYIGNGGSGATGTTAATGMAPLPAAAGFQYALQIPTTPGNTGTLYNWTTGGWVAGAAQAVTVDTLMDSEEVSIPLASLPQLGATPSTITVLGSEVTGALTAGVATAFTFPKKGASANYAEWIAYPTGSCLNPIQAVTP